MVWKKKRSKSTLFVPDVHPSLVILGNNDHHVRFDLPLFYLLFYLSMDLLFGLSIYVPNLDHGGEIIPEQPLGPHKALRVVHVGADGGDGAIHPVERRLGRRQIGDELAGRRTDRFRRSTSKFGKLSVELTESDGVRGGLETRDKEPRVLQQERPGIDQRRERGGVRRTLDGIENIVVVHLNPDVAGDRDDGEDENNELRELDPTVEVPVRGEWPKKIPATRAVRTGKGRGGGL